MRRIFLLLWTAAALSWAADPDFTGKWRLDPARSDRNSQMEPAAALLNIDHHGREIRVTSGEASPAPVMSWSFTTDRKESRYRIGESSRSTVVKWEGDSLLINTIVNGHGPSYTVMDRWKLSRNGRTLRIERQIESPHGESESTFIYEREE